MFEDVARPAGADCVKDSRGVAVADLNGDGRLDLVVNNNNDKPAIYFNQWETNAGWLQFRLTGTQSNRDAVGAVVRLTLTGAGRQKTLKAPVTPPKGCFQCTLGWALVTKLRRSRSSGPAARYSGSTAGRSRLQVASTNLWR